ncbi:MAG: hypothetical protein AB8G96_17085 [Phycisphaerales bacterium]
MGEVRLDAGCRDDQGSRELRGRRVGSALICLAVMVFGIVGIRSIDDLARGGHESAWRAVQRDRYDAEVLEFQRGVSAAYASMRASGFSATINFGPEPSGDPAIRAWRGGIEVQRAVISGPILAMALLAFFVVPWKRRFPYRKQRGDCAGCGDQLSHVGASCSECGRHSSKPTSALMAAGRAARLAAGPAAIDGACTESRHVER